MCNLTLLVDFSMVTSSFGDREAADDGVVTHEEPLSQQGAGLETNQVEKVPLLFQIPFPKKNDAFSPGRLQIPMQLSHQLQDHHQLGRGLQHNMQLARANVRVAKLFWSVYPHLLI